MLESPFVPRHYTIRTKRAILLIGICANTNYFHTPTYHFYERGYNAKRRDWRGVYAFYVFYVSACGDEVE